MEMYLGWLKAAGIQDGDAQCMMGDLYWDCFSELSEAGRIKEPNAPVRDSRKEDDENQ